MSYKSETISRFIAAICVTAVLVGCGEKVPLGATKSTFDVTYTGDLVLADSIRFQSSAPDGRDLLWMFSDGTTSIEANPKHVFYKISHHGATIIDDTVTMIVDNDVYHPNIKTFRLRPCVNKLAGFHTWKGGRFTMHGSCCPGNTNHSLADTSFPIAVVDTFTISAWGGNVPYLADSNYYSSERSGPGLYNATWIKYTPDTIYFRQRSGTSTGWSEITYFHKY